MRKWIFIFLVFCLLLDVQRIPVKAAETNVMDVYGVHVFINVKGA